MTNKVEIRNPKFEPRLPIGNPDSSCNAGTKFIEARNSKFEFLRRFRLPLSEKARTERIAARNRAERIFEVNFRPTWIR
jgi:hypothetical protein